MHPFSKFWQLPRDDNLLVRVYLVLNLEIDLKTFLIKVNHRPWNVMIVVKVTMVIMSTILVLNLLLLHQ